MFLVSRDNVVEGTTETTTTLLSASRRIYVREWSTWNLLPRDGYIYTICLYVYIYI